MNKNNKILFLFYLMQGSELRSFIHKEIKEIAKDTSLTLASLQVFYLLINYVDFENNKEKYNFLMSIKNDIIELITLELFQKKQDICTKILREFFDCFSQFKYYFKGLDYFEKFPSIIKDQQFNSIKSFLFFFAYQTKKYSSPMVKELLTQELLNAQITDGEVYLDFCMYCFFKGLYYIEKKNYFMASYLYCASIKMGLNNYSEDMFVFNHFSLQMIRTLCFLRGLSDLDIPKFLFDKQRENIKYYVDKMKFENMDECLSYLGKEKIDLDTFNNFVKINKDIYKNNKLIGLKNEVEEMLIFKKIKENIKIYKKIKLTKLSQYTGIDFNILLKIIKKKCMEGELNVKYDEENDIIDVLDVDPGKKEKVKKSQELYKSIIEGNKNYFISLRNKKLRELNNEGMMNMININNIEDDDEENGGFFP